MQPPYRSGIVSSDAKGIEVELEPKSTLQDLLTARQAECAHFASKGWTSKEIARHLGISPSTVDNHIAGAMGVLGLMRRADLKKFFNENEDGLILKDVRQENRDEHRKEHDDILQDGADRFKRHDSFLESHLRQLYFYSFFFATGLILFVWLLVILTLRLIRTMV